MQEEGSLPKGRSQGGLHKRAGVPGGCSLPATPANAMAVALMEAINPATIGWISPGMATAPSYRSLAISSNSLLLSISVAFESISMEPPVER